MSESGLKGTVNLNKLHDQGKEDVRRFWKNAAIDTATIYNDTDNPIVFYVYNYIDTIYAISAMKTTIAPHRIGTVAASGKLFKVHPNDKPEQQFLVAPQKAYLYSGPGDVSEIVDAD